MRTDYLKAIKTFFKFASLIFLLLAIFSFGEMYGKYKNEDENFITFMNKKTVYEGRVWDEIPKELKQQIYDYNRTIKYIWGAVISNFLIMIIDYFIDPKNHFFTLIKNKIDGWS